MDQYFTLPQLWYERSTKDQKYKTKNPILLLLPINKYHDKVKVTSEGSGAVMFATPWKS